MSKYSSVIPTELVEPAFIGGITFNSKEAQNEIPTHFTNKNRRRLFYVALAVMSLIAVLTVALLIYAFIV
jgi:hypothetical protein